MEQGVQNYTRYIDKGIVSGVTRRLLIVEDDPGLQSQMRWCFNEELDITVASDRDSALAALRRTEPDVVTLDLGLPRIRAGPQKASACLRKSFA